MVGSTCHGLISAGRAITSYGIFRTRIPLLASWIVWPPYSTRLGRRPSSKLQPGMLQLLVFKLLLCYKQNVGWLSTAIKLACNLKLPERVSVEQEIRRQPCKGIRVLSRLLET